MFTEQNRLKFGIKLTGLLLIWLFLLLSFNAKSAHAYVPLNPDPNWSGGMPQDLRSYLESCWSGGPAFVTWISPSNNQSSYTTSTVAYGTPSISLKFNDSGAVCVNGSSATAYTNKVESASSRTPVSGTTGGSFGILPGLINGYGFSNHTAAGNYAYVGNSFTYTPPNTPAGSGFRESGWYDITVWAHSVVSFSSGVYRCVPGGQPTSGLYDYGPCPQEATTYSIYVPVSPPPPGASLTVNVAGTGGGSGTFTDAGGHDIGDCLSSFVVSTSKVCKSGSGLGIGWHDHGGGVRGGAIVQAPATINGRNFVNWTGNSYTDGNQHCVNLTKYQRCVNIQPGSSGSITANYAAPTPAVTCNPGSQTVGVNSFATFTAGGGASGNYSWTTNPAASSSSSSGTNKMNFQAKWSSAGNNNKVTVTRGGQSATCFVNVTQPPPSCTLNANPLQVDYNDTTTLSWDISGSFTSASINNGGGTVNNAKGSKASPPITSNTTFTMTVSNASGSNNCSTTVTLTSPTCSPPGPQTNDTDWEWTFTAAQGNNSYTWSIPGAMQPGYPKLSGTGNNTAKVKWANPNNYSVYANSNGQQSNACQVNVTPPPKKPYLRFNGGDVVAGSGFGPSCTQAGSNAQILTYNDFSSGGSGAGTDLAAFAFSTIDQFTSATGRSSTPQPANGLSFSNTSNAPYGGNYGKNWCAVDYWATRSSVQSSYSTNGFTVGSAANQGVKQAIYVNGNAIINGNILYFSNGGSWNSLDDIPSFYLVVNGGNIYIDENVTQLNGVYVALPDNTTGVGGTIYTCTNGGALWNGSPISQAASLHRNCNRQLTINGAFIAKTIKFQRSFGDLSNPNPAEVFNYGPELWLVDPAAGVSPQAAPTYDSITSLPPVL